MSARSLLRPTFLDTRTGIVLLLVLMAWASNVLGPTQAAAAEAPATHDRVAVDVELQQTIISRTGVGYNQSLVSCPAGWVRSGCSGGIGGTSNSDIPAIPVGTDSCRFAGNTGRTGGIYIHCMRIGPTLTADRIFHDGFEP